MSHAFAVKIRDFKHLSHKIARADPGGVERVNSFPF